MSAKITQIIASQAFEIVRDRIGEVLEIELANQSTLASDPELDVKVYTESNFPQTNKAQVSFVNVSLANGKFDNKDSGGNVSGSYQYFIDVCANSKTPGTGQGDRLAAIKMQNILGKCRAILEDPIYGTLGFSPPYISRLGFQDLNISEPNKDDGLHTILGRLIFNVTVIEMCKLTLPKMMDGYSSKIFVNGTLKGFNVEGINYYQ